MPATVVALYRFVPIPDPIGLRDELAHDLASLGILGTLLVAHEGVNGTLAGSDAAVREALALLDRRTGVLAGEVKISHAEAPPFRRLRVRVRCEIITLRAPEADPTRRVGAYVEARDWNDVLADPAVTVVDTRNRYETRAGTFAGAIDPAIDHFTQFKAFVERDLDPAKHRTVAMFCTGGIRCEKASSYMLAHGFERVLHLRGGILRYLKEIPADRSRWQGDCYVFDERTAVAHGLGETSWTTCFGCGEPLDASDRADPSFEQGVSCRHCVHRLAPARARALRERHRRMGAARAEVTPGSTCGKT